MSVIVSPTEPLPLSADGWLHLEVLRDGELEYARALGPGSYVLGSSSEADVRLVHPGIDEVHALLFFKRGRVVLRHTATPDGLWVNGQPVGRCEVGPLDVVELGPFVLRVSPAPKGQAPAAGHVQTFWSTPHTQPRQRAPLNPRPEDPRAARATSALATSITAAATLLEPRPRPAPAPQHRAEATVYERTPTPRSRGLGGFGRWAPALPGWLAGHAAARPTDARLFLELYWGEARQDARCCQVTRKNTLKDPLTPWGFTVGPDFELAVPVERGFALKLPPRARVAQRQGAVRGSERSGTLVLEPGGAVRLVEGAMSLLAYVARPERLGKTSRLRGLPWPLMFLFLLFLGALGLFVSQTEGAAEHLAGPTSVPLVAVRLVMPKPEPKKPPEEKPDEKPDEKKEPEREKQVSKAKPDRARAKPAPVPTSKALKTLAKLTAAPAPKLLFASNAPLLKHERPSLSAMVASTATGLGPPMPGLGSGGGGGASTMGMAMFRAAGVGAMGARGFGKASAVGGTVARAKARAFGVQGSIDREAVARVVNAHLQEVRACYESALLKTASLAGKVVLEWTISTGGGVVQARSKSSTLRSPQIEACILRQLKGWAFPPARGGVVVVTYPFLFNSVGY